MTKSSKKLMPKMRNQVLRNCRGPASKTSTADISSTITGYNPQLTILPETNNINNQFHQTFNPFSQPNKIFAVSNGKVTGVAIIAHTSCIKINPFCLIKVVDSFYSMSIIIRAKASRDLLLLQSEEHSVRDSIRKMNQQLHGVGIKFTIEEVADIILSSNPHKSPGPDGLGLWFYREHIDTIAPLLTKLFNKVLTGEQHIPQDFKVGVIFKKGDVYDQTNRRPITLLNCDYKILSKSINERLKLIYHGLQLRLRKSLSRYLFTILNNNFMN
ncbi:hypothetical protein PPL_07158 [Heterostelium album PN500]|uniref:Uncharacterized protein n=1 Tax=Heterostelium pallidum (strain ATCC 26659 / Pp 5 / PN500) TaxID=670386 RepID=D3BEJ6_HETP5|nr:hypothetical protein PPL_07158 [Heterostelium album PN500]EFA80327.1 hypothetical protein PPL_07158 [Heterostelium album PN500]|eukprot:XP_020432447.1 hypothetical protein PPL_07158 [Heterostelium album PN500]